MYIFCTLFQIVSVIPNIDGLEKYQLTQQIYLYALVCSATSCLFFLANALSFGNSSLYLSSTKRISCHLK